VPFPTAPHAPRALGPPRTWVYFFLFLPYGAGSAYVTVTIGALAARGGLPDGEIAGLAALFLLPHTWKFLWAPAVDWLGTPHRWYLGANLCASAAMAGTGFVALDAGHLGALRTLVFLAGCATTLVAMSRTTESSSPAGIAMLTGLEPRNALDAPKGATRLSEWHSATPIMSWGSACMEK